MVDIFFSFRDCFGKSRGAHERKTLFYFGSAIIHSNCVRVWCNGYCNCFIPRFLVCNWDLAGTTVGLSLDSVFNVYSENLDMRPESFMVEILGRLLGTARVYLSTFVFLLTS